MGVLGDDQQRLGRLSNVPEFGFAVIAATGDDVLFIRIEVQITNQLRMRVFDRPSRFHRAQIPAPDVIIVGRSDGGGIVMRIPLSGRQFGAWIEMTFVAALLVDGGSGDD